MNKLKDRIQLILKHYVYHLENSSFAVTILYIVQVLMYLALILGLSLGELSLITGALKFLIISHVFTGVSFALSNRFILLQSELMEIR